MLLECNDNAAYLLVPVVFAPFLIVLLLLIMAKGIARTTGIVPVAIDFLQSTYVL